MGKKKSYTKKIKGKKKTCKMVEKCSTIRKKSKKKKSKNKNSKSNLNKTNDKSVNFKYIFNNNNTNKDKEVTNNKILNRIKNLRIPPAYKDVKISNDKDSYLQAVGLDNKGRKQYIYHPDFIKEKEEEKYNKVIQLGQKMKEIKRDLKLKIKKMANQNYQDMKQPEANINIILNLLLNNNFRIGSKKYADKYKSYGASTLKNNHLSYISDNKCHSSKLVNSNTDNKIKLDLKKIRNQNASNLNDNERNTISNTNNYTNSNTNKLNNDVMRKKNMVIKFIGKKGVINEDIVSQPDMINVLNKVKKNQNKYLFMYPTKDGNNQLVSNELISQALQKYHPDLTPKMIRTWRANTYLLEKLRKDHKDKNLELGKLYNKEKNKYIKLCCDHVSHKLHNTPAITKKSYLDNLLIEKLENDPKKIMKIIHNESNRRLSEDELLVHLLKKLGRKII